ALPPGQTSPSSRGADRPSIRKRRASSDAESRERYQKQIELQRKLARQGPGQCKRSVASQKLLRGKPNDGNHTQSPELTLTRPGRIRHGRTLHPTPPVRLRPRARVARACAGTLARDSDRLFWMPPHAHARCAARGLPPQIAGYAGSGREKAPLRAHFSEHPIAERFDFGVAQCALGIDDVVLPS